MLRNVKKKGKVHETSQAVMTAQPSGTGHVHERSCCGSNQALSLSVRVQKTCGRALFALQYVYDCICICVVVLAVYNSITMIDVLRIVQFYVVLWFVGADYS